MKIAALQISSVGLSPNRLDYYCKAAGKQDVKLLVLPEYILNAFFLELTKTPVDMIRQQTKKQMETLKELALKYELAIVAPIVRVHKKELFKSIAIVRGSKTTIYDQQILINYPHWNEEKFFANDIAPLQTPPVMRIEGFKVAVLAGFEIHFDWFWMELLKKDVDAVVVPSSSTFGSVQRWREILRMHAFCTQCYVLRANRIGECKDSGGHSWHFYGDSALIDPNGKILVELGDKEELLIATLDKETLKRARREWGFRNQLKKRGMV